jgi:hypothetical protein
MAARLSALRAGRFLPPGRFLVLIFVSGWVDPRAIVRLEGLSKLKKSTSSSTRTGDLPACNILYEAKNHSLFDGRQKLPTSITSIELGGRWFSNTDDPMMFIGWNACLTTTLAKFVTIVLIKMTCVSLTICHLQKLCFPWFTFWRCTSCMDNKALNNEMVVSSDLLKWRTWKNAIVLCFKAHLLSMCRSECPSGLR